MASKDALAIRREAAFARIAAAAGIEPPAANRDPDVTLTQFVEWAADVICGPEVDEAEAPVSDSPSTNNTPDLTPEETALAAAKAEAGYDQMDAKAKTAWTKAYNKAQKEKANQDDSTEPVDGVQEGTESTETDEGGEPGSDESGEPTANHEGEQD